MRLGIRRFSVLSGFVLSGIMGNKPSRKRRVERLQRTISCLPRGGRGWRYWSSEAGDVRFGEMPFVEPKLIVLRRQIHRQYSIRLMMPRHNRSSENRQSGGGRRPCDGRPQH